MSQQRWSAANSVWYAVVNKGEPPVLATVHFSQGSGQEQ